jgi:hypothetical protein
MVSNHKFTTAHPEFTVPEPKVEKRPEPAMPPAAREILAQVAQEFEMPIEYLWARGMRGRLLAAARGEAAHRLRERRHPTTNLQWSLQQIGGWIGLDTVPGVCAALRRREIRLAAASSEAEKI